ncbi:alpha/beta hydrolase [Paraburkholderia sp.]|uniref:alpha/beta hydrolase n=1 Tax=Paraburkholderia sp. TaxID=1926495 RepID=UPI00238D2700|nr:alpha/beta hydrolase [Paraburkholderia sp.]MDE1180987.1 alpha/beta hydrolase [Paraburkholderia sp.]
MNRTVRVLVGVFVAMAFGACGGPNVTEGSSGAVSISPEPTGPQTELSSGVTNLGAESKGLSTQQSAEPQLAPPPPPDFDAHQAPEGAAPVQEAATFQGAGQTARLVTNDSTGISPGADLFGGQSDLELLSPGAGPAPHAVVPQPERAKGNGRYAVMRVFFGTDRKVATKKNGSPDVESSESGPMSFGSVDVSIPRNHVVGTIESPSVLRMEFHRDPERHVSILKVAVTPYDQFRDELRTKALNAATPSVLLFIHGYNVSFEDAALRTAQMAYDLDFAGAPVFFSWPSRGTLAGYFADEQAIERAQPDIEKFVGQVLAASPGAYLYVIAHSMGNRGMTRALMNFAHNHPDQASRLREIVLAAPDIDTDVFMHQIAPGLVSIGAPVTLYASSNDRALTLSRLFHGGGPRAGDSGENLVLLKGIETIDVTNVDTDLTGHSYVGDRRTILSDLYYIIQSDARAAKRFGLKDQTRNGSVYWVFNR